MVLRWIATLLRALATQLDERDDPELAAAATLASDSTLLALRMGRLEGKLDIVLAIMGSTLFIVLSGMVTYFVQQ